MVENAGLWNDSDSRTLVYEPRMAGTASAAAGVRRTLVCMDHKGKEEPIEAPLNLYRFPEISPDGTRVALCIDNNNIRIFDLTRNTLTPLTFEGSINIAPVWTCDSKRIVLYSMERTEKEVAGGIYWKAADGTGSAKNLCSSTSAFSPYCFSCDGKTLVGAETADLTTFDIGKLLMEGDREGKRLLHKEYIETQSQISPDRR